MGIPYESELAGQRAKENVAEGRRQTAEIERQKAMGSGQKEKATAKFAVAFL